MTMLKYITLMVLTIFTGFAFLITLMYTLIDVQWEYQEYSTATPPQDIALESTYPESRWGAE